MTGAFAGACLVAAALVVGWPERSRRARQRRLGLPADRRPAGWLGVIGRVAANRRVASGHRVASGRGVALSRRLDGRIVAGRLEEHGAWSAAAALAAILGMLLGGPVAAALGAGYGAMAARWLGRRQRRRAAALVRGRLLDSLGLLAADLRAGLPPNLPAASIVDGPAAPGDPLSARALAAVSLAESTGAPLADLLERIEADARAGDHAAAAAEAQGAGARATALLLAGLPAAGIALGYAIGADPLRVLLHTPVGAACALAALALQLAGLGWSARLARSMVTT